MSSEHAPHGHSVSGAFHPLVYKVLAGLALWFVLSAWGFAGGGHTDFVLGVVTLFFLVSVGLPGALALTRRSRRAHSSAESEEVFDGWARREIDLFTGPAKGRLAAIEAALPIAAVAFGMTAFALVVHFAVS
jgi:hypothetical protein